ncbi:MAG: MBL fold metallo-hydrolase [Candidatus Kaistia colombiensis]|nr:MAG: MBL fold metallo-hydrolase [Kaistia sp.]
MPARTSATSFSNARVDRIDAVLFTHPHADHTHGIDDLRSFSGSIRTGWCRSIRTILPRSGWRRRLAIVSGRRPAAVIRRSSAGRASRQGRAFPSTGRAASSTSCQSGRSNGDIDSLGFRIGDFVYSSDISAIPDESLPHLADMSLWMVDALRWRPHPSHFSVDDTLAWHERLRPRKTILTHMHGDLDYAALVARIPGDVEPAYDGMVVALAL